jgi:hypothetical protein
MSCLCWRYLLDIIPSVISDTFLAVNTGTSFQIFFAHQFSYFRIGASYAIVYGFEVILSLHTYYSL